MKSWRASRLITVPGAVVSERMLKVVVSATEVSKKSSENREETTG